MATDAKQIITSFLDDYGLGSLGEWAWNSWLSSGYSDLDSFVRDKLMLDLPKQEAFKQRFPAYEQVNRNAANNGGVGITIDGYKNYEEAAKNNARLYGIPESMFTSQYIADALTSGVSEKELEQRMAINRNIAINAPAEVKQAMRDLYGISDVDGALTAYYFEPDRALNELQQQSAAAQVAGAALENQVSIGRATAERLAAQGVSYDEARQGFNQVGQDKALASGFGEQVSVDTMAQGQFGSAPAALETARVRSTKKAEFAGGGGAADSTKGVSGLGSTSR